MDVRTYLINFYLFIEGINEANLGPINDDEQMERLQVLMQERAEQQEQRQQNFDEQNFGLARGEEVVIIDMNQMGPSGANRNHQEEVIMLSEQEIDEDEEA